MIRIIGSCFCFVNVFLVQDEDENGSSNKRSRMYIKDKFTSVMRLVILQLAIITLRILTIILTKFA